MTTARWRAVLWLGTLAIVGLVAWQARHALLPFALGAVLAYAIAPVVDRIAALIPARTRTADVWRRGVVVLLIYVAFFGSIVGTGLLLAPLAVEQVEQFIDELPVIAEEAREQIVAWIDVYRSRVPTDVQARLDDLAENAAVAAANALAAGTQRAFGAITGTVAFIFGLVIVPFFMFYAMRDRHYITGSITNAAPAELRTDVANIGRLTDFMLGRYIRAQLLLGLLVGTAVGIGLTLMGVQLSLALAVWAGITELIPILGPWIGAIPALIIVAATQPELFLWVVLLYLGVQAAENYLLIPRIQKQAVDVHPAMVLVLLATAGALWGIIGMLVIIPIAAIAREIFWYAEHRLRGDAPDEAMAYSFLHRRLAAVPADTADRESEDSEDSDDDPVEEVAVTATGGGSGEADVQEPDGRRTP